MPPMLGVSPVCPANSLQPAGYVCRAARGDCDVVEKCTGTSATCPADAVDGSRCNDGKACTTDSCGLDGMCRYIPIGVCS